MVKNVDEMQQFSKDNMDVAMKSFGTMSSGLQAIASEFANFSKAAMENHAAAAEKLMGAKSMEKALEVQSEYMKSAYERYIAHATKLGELYSGLAREMYGPLGSVMGKKPFSS
jgi:phasin family protein